jgi:hypothetical protein
MRHKLTAGALAIAGAALVTGTGHDARACGGCFAPPPPATQSGTVVTDERMIFAISRNQTTLYDQLEYTGSPDSFAWVLPVTGPVTVALSADSLFGVVDQATQTTIVAPYPTTCAQCTNGSSSSSGGGTSSGGGGPRGTVTIISQQVVGPYATVQLSATDPNSLTAWLTANGYVIASNVTPIIAQYVREGFDFLAMRLAPGQGVQAMRPVAVTMPGIVLSLPLRMLAAGTGPTVGLTLWVVADGRYEPMNFPSFIVAPSELTWNFALGESDYATIRAQREAAMNNAAWQIESSISVSPVTIESVLMNDVTSDYAPVPSTDGGAPDGGAIAGQTADQVRAEDLATLFAGGPSTVRVTRMRADLSQAALANDLALRASQDQSVLSNVYNVTKTINDVVCPPFDAASCSGLGDTFPAQDGGENASSGGDAAPADPYPPASRSGCAVGPNSDGGSENGAAFTALVGLALFRTMKKRR